MTFDEWWKQLRLEPKNITIHNLSSIPRMIAEMAWAAAEKNRDIYLGEVCFNQKCLDYAENYDDHCSGHGVRYDGHKCIEFKDRES